MTTVQILVNHFLITNGDHTARVEFSDLTPEQEAELRALAAAQRQPRNVKRTRKHSRSRAGKFMHKGYSPADAIVAGDILNINENKI